MMAAENRIVELAKTTAQGAVMQVWAAVAAKFEGKGGLYLDDVQTASECTEPSVPGSLPGRKPWLWDEETAARLWRDSNRTIGFGGAWVSLIHRRCSSSGR
jgi:hypothetical protein